MALRLVALGLYGLMSAARLKGISLGSCFFTGYFLFFLIGFFSEAEVTASL